MAAEKIKVLIGPSTFCDHDKAPLDLLSDSGFEVISNPHKRKLTKEETIALLSGNVAGLIAGLEPLDKDVLTKTKLKVISRCGSGMSNVDLATAKALGIKVYSTPDAPVNAVAELTVGSILSLLRASSFMDKELHEGRWSKKIGRELAGKTVAIVGFGRIGRRVALLLKNFGVKLIAVDPALTGIVEGVKIVTLAAAVKEADILSLHTNGDKELIGEKEFAQMKDGVVLLNAARGGLINEAALIKALESKKIAGAGLDTFSTEPYNGPLLKYSQVLLTPHIGSYTLECRKSMDMEAAQNLIKGFKNIK